MAGYIAPVNADVPQPGAMFLLTQDIIAGPIGGLGELVIVGLPAAIFDAMFNAIGKRVTELAITRERLLWR